LVFVALGVTAVACGDDDDSAPVNTGSGGDAGAPSSSGGKGGGGSSSAGTSAAGTQTMVSGGAGGVGGMSGGEAGAGGTPIMTPAGELCTACGDVECKATMKACSDNPECSPWLTCVAACDTAACITSCDRTHENVARIYRGVYDCLCTSCADDCAPAKACNKKTCVDNNPLPVTDTAPATLAETGLYAFANDAAAGGAGGAGGADGAGGGSSVDLAMPIAIAGRVHKFEPKYPLWADGAVKDRYVYIPKCSTIDDTDMDHWNFPVGTRFWKTFTVEGKVVETRMLERFGTGAVQWVYAAYQWDVNSPTDPTLAKWTNDTAVVNANGTTHDIPGKAQCTQCHNTGLTEKILGFSAFQLSHDTSGNDLTIKRISDLGWLTTPAPDGFQVPGTPVQQAALGYMHGNCGGCHNNIANIPNGNPQILRLSVGQKTYATTDAVISTVGVVVQSGNAAIAGKSRIAAHDPTNSAILIRMKDRGTGLQMPPLGTVSTKLPDTDGGVKALTDWINSIP